MDPTSRHLLLDLWLDEPVTDVLVEGLLERARAELHVVREAVHRFEPQGLTALFVLAESHFALHTYPEADYLSLDVYVCAPELDVEGLADRLVAPLAVRRQQRQVLWRGRAPGVRGLTTTG